MWVVLLFCIIAAFADVIGGTLTILKRFNQKQMMIITGLGTGFLLGATILDRLPEAMHELPSMAPLYIIIGYLFLLVIGQFSVHRSHSNAHGIHGITTKEEAEINQKSVLISFIGLLFHTFMDGVIIAGAFAINPSTGVLIFFAIAMHKIPEGFSMATISLASGSSRKRALLTSSSLAVSTIIGALVTIQIGGIDAGFVKILMALATGTFLFVSTTDMVPIIRKQHWKSTLYVSIGVAVFYVSLLLIQQNGLG